MDKETRENTLVLIKPDALKNSLTGYILSQLSEFHTGLHFAGTKIVSVTKVLAEEHYEEHRGKFFYPSLLDYIMGMLHYDVPWKRRVIAFVYQGPNAIKKIRDIAGPTNPHDARVQKPGCIRALGTVVPVKDENGKPLGDRVDNLIHASANATDSEREIKLWFKPTDIPPFMRDYATEVCEEHYYLKGDSIRTAYEPGSVNFLAPGDLVWKSDLDSLHLHKQGLQAPCTINTIVAKYLVNKDLAG